MAAYPPPGIFSPYGYPIGTAPDQAPPPPFAPAPPAGFPAAPPPSAFPPPPAGYPGAAPSPFPGAPPPGAFPPPPAGYPAPPGAFPPPPAGFPVPGAFNPAALQPGVPRERVAVVGSSGTVYIHHDFSNPALPWVPLPGPTPFASGASLVFFQGGLFVFAVCASKKLHYNVMNAAGAWGGWTMMPDGGTEHPPAAVVHNNALHLFVRGNDTRVYTKKLEGAWTPWVEMPGSGLTPSSPAAAAAGGRLLVVVQGTDHHIYENGDHGSGFQHAWTKLSCGGMTHHAPAATVHDGRIVLFVRGTDGALYTAESHHHGHWAGWTPLPNAPHPVDAPAATTQHGQVVVALRLADNSLWRGARHGGAWQPFSLVRTPEPVAHAPSLLAV